MTQPRNKLELTWIGKDRKPSLEPRILLEDLDYSYHSPYRRSGGDQFDNQIIHGDNLLALRALESDLTGRVKCVYIDPPYNTGAAYDQYDDGVEHSIWLSLMRDRLEILKRLLRNDGSIWVSIDDHEAHYLKVLMDEVFGRQNFIASIIWQKIYTIKNSARHFSDMHEYILVYAKSAEDWQRNLLPRSSKLDSTYSNPDDDPRGPWTTNAVQARNYYSQGSYEIRSPTGRLFRPPTGTFWRISKESFDQLERDGRIWWGRSGSNVPRIKKFLSEAKQGVVPSTFWPHDECGQNAEAKTEIRKLFADRPETEIFPTPKPERLIKRILELATSPGDLVLDSFAGSGTTGAVAQKMGRKWVMIELGDHCFSHVIPRLSKVIDGTDDGGISQAVAWNGGGGFRFYRLAPSLLEQDKWGNWIVSKQYNAEMLAEAMCRLTGFHYAPSNTIYWQQGQSTEKDFIYITTQTLIRDQLQHLSDEVGEDRTLLVCCSAFRTNPDDFPNLTITKIPAAVLDRCEWGRDDYSLNVQNLPMVVDTNTGTKKESQRSLEELPLFQPAGED